MTSTPARIVEGIEAGRRPGRGRAQRRQHVRFAEVDDQDEDANHEMQTDEDGQETEAMPASPTATNATTYSSSSSSRRRSGRSSPDPQSMHPLSLSPQSLVSLVQRSASILFLGVPKGVHIGVDYWNFVVGEKFKGIKFVPPGVHYVWFSSMIGGGNEDMAPRVGFFVWLDAQDVLVRRWDAQLESLVSFDDPDEESRYAAGVRRMDFDSNQGSYPIHASAKWSRLTCFMSRGLVQRLEPVGKYITNFGRKMYGAEKKYKIEDKFPGGIIPPEVKAKMDAQAAKEQEARQQDEQRMHDGERRAEGGARVEIIDEEEEEKETDTHMTSDVPTSSDASSAAASSAATAASSADSIAQPVASSTPSAPSTTPADTSETEPSTIMSKSSTSFYTRVPSIPDYVSYVLGLKPVPPATVSSSETNPSDPSAIEAARRRAEAITSLHMDRTPLLEYLLENKFGPAGEEDLKDESSNASLAPPPPASLTPADRALLGELQFSFISFLIGQDQEGYDAWKALTILLAHSIGALSSHHALMEVWVEMLQVQLQEIPRDFFVDTLSGDSFLHKALNALFRGQGESIAADSGQNGTGFTIGSSAAPESLTWKLRSLHAWLRERFLWTADIKLPPDTTKEQREEERRRRQAEVEVERMAAMAARSTSMEESKEPSIHGPATIYTATTESAPNEEAQRRALLRQLQQEAEEDEYAPTVAEEY